MTSISKDNQERHLKELADLVAIRTLRVDPNHHPDVQKAGEVLKERLEKLGLKVTSYFPDYPFITVEWMGSPGQPTALFYGHFDVHPVAPKQ